MMYPEYGEFAVTIKLRGTYRNDYPHLYPMGIVEDAAERLWNAESTAYNRVIAEIKSGRFDWTSEGD